MKLSIRSQKTSKIPSLTTKCLGSYGEKLAFDYLKKKGYQIINKNFKARYGEIDLIAVIYDTLVFIEVKTRTGKSFGTPEEAITQRKLRDVIKTAQYYLLLHPDLPKSHRIDVIAIELYADKTIRNIRHIENVTQ